MKRVNVNILCHVCNSGVETTKHALVDCSFARACLQNIGMIEEINRAARFKDRLVGMMDSQNKEVGRMVVMLCWSLWRARNEVVWKKHGMDVTDVVLIAKSTLDKWINAQDKSFDTFLGFMTLEDGVGRWKTPNVNMIKINMDTAIFKESNYCSFALVAHDHTGTLIETSSRCL